MKKDKIFINSLGERHKLIRMSKGGNKVTAENLADNELYVFYFDVQKMKFIKAYTSDTELGTIESNN